MFGNLMVHKYKRDTLLRIVEKEPFDFEPGEALIYNNTAFYMLGLIIEKVSGESYEMYVKKNLFDKAGMTNSYYCSENKITKNRAHGYDGAEKELVRAAYLDHTWPYAAGSLCSTTEDLESYTFKEKEGRTELIVEIETPPSWENMFNEGWPIALKKLKEICER